MLSEFSVISEPDLYSAWSLSHIGHCHTVNITVTFISLKPAQITGKLPVCSIACPSGQEVNHQSSVLPDLCKGIPSVSGFSLQETRALYYLRFCDTSQVFQPMVSQLSKKAALPLAKILATCRNSVSNTGPSNAENVSMWWRHHEMNVRLGNSTPK